MHDYSLYIAATVTVKAGTTILQNPKLDEQAAQLLTAPATQEQFRKMYGDAFLGGITSGGELIVFLEIQTHSQSDFEEVDASIRGSDLTGLNQGSAHFHSSLSDISSKYQLTIHQFQRGGDDLSGPKTPESLAAKASSFANTVTGDKVFDYIASFQTYDVLPRPAGANPIQIDNQRSRLQQMGLYRLRYTQLLNSIEYVLFNPQQFEAFDDKALVKKQKELNDALSALTNAASRCFTDPTTPGNCDIPTLPDPVFPLPKRLDTTTIGAVQAAKEAANRTQGHAKACIESAQKVLEISQTIKTGPQGKDLADQARLALQNAQDAYNLAQNALSDTLVVADLSDQVTQSKNSAKSSVQIAEDALGVAKSKYDVAYAIGYAPYWNAPTVIHLTRSSAKDGFGDGYISPWFFCVGEVYPSNIPCLSLGTLVSDPAGGEVNIEQACANPTKFSNVSFCPVGDLPMVSGGQTSVPCSVAFWYNPTDQRHLHGFSFAVSAKPDPNPPWNQDTRQFADKVYPGSIILVSTKSGLRTLVTFQLLCFAGRKISDSYIQGNQIVTSGRSSLYREGGSHESQRSLGWKATPLTQSRTSGDLELRRVVQ